MPDQPHSAAHIDSNMLLHKPKISVVGLGKLGAPLAAVFAEAGYKVCGVDVSAELVGAFQENRLPFEETGLSDCLKKAEGYLSATTDFDEAVRKSDISFVIVPTPSGENGLFDNSYVLSAARALGKAIAKKATYHLVVITSTVVPGSTGGEIQKTLEDSSGRLVGQDLGLCYSPEFIALGSVIRDMKNPDMILIGESDAKAGDTLEQVYRNTCESSPAYRRMAFANAELAKIAVNTFVTTKISYINMLSAICDQIEDGDVDAVSAALGADSRIGAKYIKGGAAYGGPCFPRDNKALAAFAKSVGVDARIATATDAVNDDQIERLVNIARLQGEGAHGVAILGLSYKTDTAVVEESAGMRLLAALSEAGVEVSLYDPMAAVGDISEGVTVCSALADAVEGSDQIFLMTPWPEFQKIPRMVNKSARNYTVVDPWRLFGASDFSDTVTYVALGRAQAE